MKHTPRKRRVKTPDVYKEFRDMSAENLLAEYERAVGISVGADRVRGVLATVELKLRLGVKL